MKLKQLILLFGSATALLFLSGCDARHDLGLRSENEASIEAEEIDLETEMSEGEASSAVYGGMENGTGDGAEGWRELLTAGSVASSDSSRQFIRTAEMKFRVEHLATSIYAIEEIVREQGGFVQQSDMQDFVSSTRKTPVSRDSILETTLHRLSCTMTVRVPAERLDTVMLLIANHIDVLDYRRLKAEEVTLDLQGQRQLEKRYRKYTSEPKPRTDSAAEIAFKRTLEGDAAALKLRKLNDRIRFGTLTLHLYQRETTRQEVLPQPEEVQPYRPGFWTEAGNALSRGLNVLKVIALFLIHIWWLLLGGAITWGVLWCRKRCCRRKKQ
ncbi:DUF4349 domain-containing protein [uncultured Rikenella sp.]|uniref:DUF4349 domain-containing protein n=1 Tax=uncultured Rikenella sp. TaxID=368003 RepID=UPI0025EE34B4|nr:DUF4349 domain-containing protein [uncultured Rikenella sp.]